MRIEIKVLNKEFYKKVKMGGEYYDLPRYQTNGSGAMDLICTENVTIRSGETKMLPTGLAIWIGSGTNGHKISSEENPEYLDFIGMIAPRSSYGSEGLMLANTIGIIDSDYQGELKILAWNRLNNCNLNKNVIKLKAGDRIAQLMLLPVIKAKWEMVEEFHDKTLRGCGGFGSTN